MHGAWQYVFLALAVGIPAIIVLYVLVMLVRAVRYANPSMDFLASLAAIAGRLVGRARRTPADHEDR